MGPLSKSIIGMVHLKALPKSPLHTLPLEEILAHAQADLLALQQGGATAAIVENFFDTPYSVTPSLETLTAFTYIFTRLKAKAGIPLGVNIQYTGGVEEMIIASLCGAEFIRAETFVENRSGSFGILYANCAALTRCRKDMGSAVRIFADINVKHSFPLSPQPLEYSIAEAIASGADALIVTGLQTGKTPGIDEVKELKKSCTLPLYLGSGVTSQNIAQYLEHIDGVIAGTSIKQEGKIDRPVSAEKVRALRSAADGNSGKAMG